MAEKACLAAHNMLRFKHDVCFTNRYRLGTGTIRDNARVSFFILYLKCLLISIFRRMRNGLLTTINSSTLLRQLTEKIYVK